MSTEYLVVDGVVQEWITPEPFMNPYTSDELEDLISSAKARKTIKEAEIVGIDDEIKHFEEMLALLS